MLTRLKKMETPLAVLLVHIIPKPGFIWKENEGAPRILAHQRHDQDVRNAIMAHPKFTQFNRRCAEPMLAEIFDCLAFFLDDELKGIDACHDIASFLMENQGGTALGRRMYRHVFVDLVNTVTKARLDFIASLNSRHTQYQVSQSGMLAQAVDALMIKNSYTWEFVDWTDKDMEFIGMNRRWTPCCYENDEADKDWEENLRTQSDTAEPAPPVGMETTEEVEDVAEAADRAQVQNLGMENLQIKEDEEGDVVMEDISS
ncbi:hypothetical protein GQ53DRAFT_814172 [Thozetella sp. PMI_491]|nr:hypothetical protein GQ53DRAFT_814172 [Thozetella sp. PMI_491]